MFSAAFLCDFIQKLESNRTIWIAYSGGLDSQVLLHLLSQLRSKISQKIKAVHINHQLSPNANQWQLFCQKNCQVHNIEFHSFSVQIDIRTGESIENLARKARYETLKPLLNEGDYLFTAHQEDDQAETLLLQLFRGAGVSGLAAMPQIKSFGLGYLVRPLLHTSREAIADYAKQHNLNWIDDESNANIKFDRNYIRNEILPVIKKKWPKITKTLSRSAENCAIADKIMHDLAEIDLLTVKDTQENKLKIKALLHLSQARRNNVLRYWLKQSGFPLPNNQSLQKITDEIMLSANDADPILKYDCVVLRRFNHCLYVMYDEQEETPDEIQWVFLNNHPDQRLFLPNKLGTLIARQNIKNALRLSNNQILKVTFRVGGEKIQPQGRHETHELKKLFQEWQVPTWLRSKIPLIYCGDELIAVVGYCISEKFSIKPGEVGWEIIHSP